MIVRSLNFTALLRLKFSMKEKRLRVGSLHALDQGQGWYADPIPILQSLFFTTDEPVILLVFFFYDSDKLLFHIIHYNSLYEFRGKRF